MPNTPGNPHHGTPLPANGRRRPFVIPFPTNWREFKRFLREVRFHSPLTKSMTAAMILFWGTHCGWAVVAEEVRAAKPKLQEVVCERDGRRFLPPVRFYERGLLRNQA